MLVLLKRASFGGGIVSSLASPAPFSREKIGRFALDLISILAPEWDLEPEHVKLRAGDFLFDYELTVHLFDRLATFQLNASELRLEFIDGRSDEDLAVIARVAEAIYRLFPADAFSLHEYSAFLHAAAADDDARQRLSGDLENLTFQGALIRYRTADHWPEEVRLTVDKSFLVQHGAFISASSSSFEPVNSDSLRRFIDASLEAAKAINFELQGPEPANL